MPAFIGSIEFITIGGAFQRKVKEAEAFQRKNVNAVGVQDVGDRGVQRSYECIRDFDGDTTTKVANELQALQDLVGTFVTVVDDLGVTRTLVGVVKVRIPARDSQGFRNPAKLGVAVGGILNNDPVSATHIVTAFIDMVDTQ